MAAENSQSPDDQLRKAYFADVNQTIIRPIVDSSLPAEVAERLEVTRRMLKSGVVQVVVGGFANPVPQRRIDAAGGQAMVDMVIDLAKSDHSPQP